MKFVPPDTCMEDYVARRSEFLKNLIDTTASMRERNKRFKKWIDKNSPFSAAEKLENLMRALQEA
jgi:hypothetical protein